MRCRSFSEKLSSNYILRTFWVNFDQRSVAPLSLICYLLMTTVFCDSSSSDTLAMSYQYLKSPLDSLDCTRPKEHDSRPLRSTPTPPKLSSRNWTPPTESRTLPSSKRSLESFPRKYLRPPRSIRTKKSTIPRWRRWTTRMPMRPLSDSGPKAVIRERSIASLFSSPIFYRPYQQKETLTSRRLGILSTSFRKSLATTFFYLPFFLPLSLSR